MFFIILGITGICLLLCGVQGLVYIWERLEKRGLMRTQPHRVPPAHAARIHMLPRAARYALPDRDQIGCVHALSEQFADRFREVVNS